MPPPNTTSTVAAKKLLSPAGPKPRAPPRIDGAAPMNRRNRRVGSAPAASPSRAAGLPVLPRHPSPEAGASRKTLHARHAGKAEVLEAVAGCPSRGTAAGPQPSSSRRQPPRRGSTPCSARRSARQTARRSPERPCASFSTDAGRTRRRPDLPDRPSAPTVGARRAAHGNNAIAASLPAAGAQERTGKSGSYKTRKTIT